MRDWRSWYLLVFLTPLVVNPFGLGPYEIPKQVYLMLFVVFASLYFVVSKLKILKFSISAPLIFVLLWGLSIFISSVFGISPYESFWGSTERMQGAWTWTLYLAHFLICLYLFKDEFFKKSFLGLTVVVGVVLSIYAILQQLGVDPLNISDINEASGRSFATAGQPNLLGQLLIFPIFVLIVFFWKEKLWKKKVFFFISLMVVFTGLFSTLNRASILAVGLSAVMLVFYKSSKKLSPKLVVPGIFFLLAVAFILFEVGGGRSLYSRISLLKPAPNLVIENPFIGTGPETTYKSYQAVLDKNLYSGENLFDIPDRVHNEPMQILLDQGIFGFALYAILLWFLLKLFWKGRLKNDYQIMAFFSILAYIISVQFSFSLSAQMIFLSGMWALMVADVKLGGRQFFRISNKFSIALVKFFVLAVCFFYVRSGFSIIYADVLFARGLENYFSQNGLSEQYFEAAAKFNPNSRYYLYHGTNLSLGELEDATLLNDFLQKNLSRLKTITGDGYHYDLAAANYYANKRDFAKADRHFSLASTKAPNWPFVWQQWGDYLFEREDYERAIEKYEKLLGLVPAYWEWKDDDKVRLFKKNNSSVLMALHRLVKAYRESDMNDKAEALSLKISK